MLDHFSGKKISSREFNTWLPRKWRFNRGWPWLTENWDFNTVNNTIYRGWNINWQILENSSEYFPKFKFSGRWPISGKFVQFFSKFQHSSHELDQFLENLSIYGSRSGSIFQKTVSVKPENSKIDNWMSFPEISLVQDPILNKTEYVLKKFAWMSFPEIGLVVRGPWT